MQKREECRRYKWSSPATNLLLSIWCHDMVQNHLKTTSRNQPIWESIARYMTRKGFTVTGLQCKTRIKNMLCTYQEAIRKNNPSLIEPYFDVFKKVLSDIPKKKEQKQVKEKQFAYSIETDEDSTNSFSNSTEKNSNIRRSYKKDEFQMEFSDISNQDYQPGASVHTDEFLKGLENVIMKAIKCQTKALTDVIQMQSQLIEKLLLAEKEKLDILITSKTESQKILENKLDKLLSRLEKNSTSEGLN